MTKKELRVIIGRMIRAERIKRDMSIDEVAKLLNLSPGFVGLIERGERGVTVYNLYSLSNIFGISMDAFFLHSDAVAAGTSETAKKCSKISSLISVMDNAELDYFIDNIKSVRTLADAIKAQRYTEN